MTFRLILIIIAWVSLTYLIYRYARYSPWRSTMLGQAFMMMKAALWACLAFLFVARLIPSSTWLELIRDALVIFITAAVLTQTYAVVKLQGGYRRRHERRTGSEDLASQANATL